MAEKQEKSENDEKKDFSQKKQVKEQKKEPDQQTESQIGKQGGKEQLYLQLQLVTQQIESLEKQVEMVKQQLGKLDSALQAVDALVSGQAKKGSSLLSPLAPGIFAQAKIEKDEELIVNVGAGVAVKKSTQETKELVQKQLQELNQYYQQLQQELEKMGSAYVALQGELKNLKND